jgi:FdhD protein
MSNKAISTVTIKKADRSILTEAEDLLAREEPLEIKLEHGPAGKKVTKGISVTMRTPGADFELAAGFLYTEGIVTTPKDVLAVCHSNGINENVVTVTLADDLTPQINNLERNFYTTSSCGICGKSSIDAITAMCNIADTVDHIRISHKLLYELPVILRTSQNVFNHTGGLHAAALFSTNGELLFSREDVGRHNALDKLIGAALFQKLLPLDNHILMLSGRASFELVQKAAMAGIKVIAAVGAPSSLAVDMAVEWGITLIGFLRGERFNIYSGAERILI